MGARAVISCRPRTLAAALWVAVALGVLAVGAQAGSSALAGTGLTLDGATVNANWKESWLKGNVTFTGMVGAESELNAFLRRLDPGPKVVVARVGFTAAEGAYTGTLKFPNRARPGTYLLRVAGTSGGAKLAPVETTVRLPAPEEGIVGKAFVSKTKKGKAVRRVKGPVKQLFATFKFIVPPKVRSVRLVWRTPQFNFVGEVRKPWRKTIKTFVKSNRPLAKGRWYCLLTVNEIVTKRVSVRIR